METIKVGDKVQMVHRLALKEYTVDGVVTSSTDNGTRGWIDFGRYFSRYCDASELTYLGSIFAVDRD